MGDTQTMPTQPAPAVPTVQIAPSLAAGTAEILPLQSVDAENIGPCRESRTSTTTPSSTDFKGRAAFRESSNRCFVCFEPCVTGSAAFLRTRQDAWAMVCRLTVNGVRVGPGEPFTSVVRGTHYARPSAFDCSSCSASVCVLCLCRRLRAGIQYVAQHPLTCACGEVSLVNETTVLFLTPEQEHSLYLRCDEWYCSDPLYCPVPTCSAYIPMLPCLLHFGRSKRASNSSSGELPTRNGKPVPCMRPNIHHNKDIERFIQEKGYRKCAASPSTGP
ncbi:hypothetical protein Sste5344_004895 [Sporothrix stenoceras]